MPGVVAAQGGRPQAGRWLSLGRLGAAQLAGLGLPSRRAKGSHPVTNNLCLRQLRNKTLRVHLSPHPPHHPATEADGEGTLEWATEPLSR